MDLDSCIFILRIWQFVHYFTLKNIDVSEVSMMFLGLLGCFSYWVMLIQEHEKQPVLFETCADAGRVACRIHLHNVEV